MARKKAAPPPSIPEGRVVVVTGLSGTGKSTVVKAFEDCGWFCVDNVPPVLLPQLIDLVGRARGGDARVALVADVRGKEFLPDFARVLDDLAERPGGAQVIFLDADEKVLLRRFSETRREHPLSTNRGGTREAIRRERILLDPLRRRADRVLDTSGFNVHQLRDVIVREFGLSEDGFGLGVVSFGFRNGLPSEADMVVDVRFLPNPHYLPILREKTGHDLPVRRFVIGSAVGKTFLARLLDFLKFLLPLYTKEGKTHFTLGIGCTGGRHRSVAVAEAVGKALSREGVRVSVAHRDLPVGPVQTTENR